MDTIIKNYGLDKKGYTQKNVEFVNVRLDKDNQLFVDYDKILKFSSIHTARMKVALDEFLKALFTALRFKKSADAAILLEGLHECNPTKLGWSRNRPRGNSVGNILKELIQDNAQYVVDALGAGHFSYNTLYFGVDQVGPDRISDIVISIIKADLIKFTQEQCHKHSIPMKSGWVKNLFNSGTQTWEGQNLDLPQYDAQPVIFIPKQIISDGGSLTSTFDRFLRYGFGNFVKNNPEYDFLKAEGADSIKRKDYYEYLQNEQIKDKDEVKKWVSENNTAIVDFQSYNYDNVNELTTDELEKLIS